MKQLLRSVWRWIDKDLYESNPHSTLLFVVPFAPAAIARALGASSEAADLLLLSAVPFSFGWLGYVFYRIFTHAGRSFQVSVRRANGNDGTVCPVCLTDLPDPPEAERYKFGGWICDKCEAEIDRYGREVTY